MSRIRHKHYTPPAWDAPDLLPLLKDVGEIGVRRVPNGRGELTFGFQGDFEQEPPSVPVDTSEAAARKVEGKSAYWRAEIYALLTSCGALGATEREIEHALHLSGNTVRPRLWELEGNAPAGRPLRVALIRKTPRKRDGARVYVAI